VTALETAVRVVIDLLVRQEYATVEAVTRGKRLNAEELARAVDEYGRTLVPPSDDWWSTVEITPLSESASAFHVAAPLWSAEEGRSDLTLELRLEESIAGIFDTEVLNLHVL
jgi:hypothetical protein